jgi:hypothetical protein
MQHYHCCALLTLVNTATTAALQVVGRAASEESIVATYFEKGQGSVDPGLVHVGVLGGGQLGRMMALAAVRLDVHLATT